ncbi:MAG TPA: carbamoyltransferase HypF [Gemmatimonadaceae bacterium]|nr:carbamoyltransferase HypF [Gemmatimonadaceae bacterium]
MTLAVREGLVLHVTGVVQGVGFRPFVHRLAIRHALDGWVRNQAGDVEIAVEGEPERLEAFRRALVDDAPPLARISEVRGERAPARGLAGFRIVESTDHPDRRQPVAADVSMCEACERELYDPASRRHRYPFITCTDCGPRYSVIERLPYDRARTSMRAFAQCPECRREYDDPASRRYHSETNSCPACGPTLHFELAGEPAEGAAREPEGDPLALAAAWLRWGAVVALRGMGGYHLACDATNECAVARLRARKHREAKPLAVMVRDDAAAREIAEVDEEEARWLDARERPIVLLRRRASGGLAHGIAPGLGTVGVMLAYTPLHSLLLDIVRRPLVMTSANLSEEPLAAGVEEARARLADIADAFLWHDREIVARIDDSVMRVARAPSGAVPVWMRRARGYAPMPVAMPVEAPAPLVAVGPHLKNTFTLAHGRTAYVSQHVGDLDNLETLEHFRATLERYERLHRVTPEAAVRDLHPGYLSTRAAGELGLERVIAVQHHHAHIAAVMAEHGVTAPVIGIAWDGTGYGTDGAVWGAEILLAGLAGFERLAQLRYAPLPGGDAAVRAPWRTALGYLSLDPSLHEAFALSAQGIDQREQDMAALQTVRGINAPRASSMGRLFDAAAAVLGVRRVARFEGQAAMELESLAGSRRAAPLPMPVVSENGTPALDPLPLLAALGARARAGANIADLAAALHESVVHATAALAMRLCSDHGIGTVALGGGCFQNARLLVTLTDLLRADGLTVLHPRTLPPNDGAVSYGQAVVGAAVLSAECSVLRASGGVQSAKYKVRST